jgi:hypothetical protein
MMTRFSTYFISADRVSSRKVNMALFSWVIETMSDGGTSSCRFAGDGDTSFLGLHLTLIFPSYVHMALQ